MINKLFTTVTSGLLLTTALYSQEINITSGWQMKGSDSGFSDMSILNKTCIDVVWSYNNNTNKWKAYSPNGNTMQMIRNSSDLTELTNISLNEGFWIKANNTCSIGTNSLAIISQQTVDANGDINDVGLLQALNNAFNDVIDSNIPNNIIAQMNASDDDDMNGDDAAQRLSALGTVSLGVAVVVVTDVPRIAFVPFGAAAYIIKVTRAGSDVNLANANVNVQNGLTVAAGTANVNATATTLITPADAASVTAVEFTIAAGTVRVGDILTITPIDDLGTYTSYTLKDNVAPTTILQNSYGLGNSISAIADTMYTHASVGTPYLAITAGLLDNKNAIGELVNGIVASDNALTAELYTLNTINTYTSLPYISSNSGMYDSTAWNTFDRDSNLERIVGVAFSEDIDLNGITPVTSGITFLSNWQVFNDAIMDDDGMAINQDFIYFTAANIITLANIDTGKVIDFTGISDTAKTPNVTTTASNARVVLLDRMPPFVTSASFDGSNVVITFNEPIKTLANGETFTITGAATRTATYSTANIAKYVFSNSNKTLTIAATEFAGLTKADFNLASYVESAYGSVARAHAALSWTVNDAKGNDWATDNAGVAAPKFAVAEMIGNFTVTTNASAFLGANNTTTTVQTVVWTFAHPIRTSNVADLMNGVVADASGNFVWTGALDLASIQAWFEGVVVSAGATTTVKDIAAPNATSLVLSSDKKTLTFKFTTTADIAAGGSVRMVSTKTIVSNTDTTQTVDGNALAATAQ